MNKINFNKDRKIIKSGQNSVNKMDINCGTLQLIKKSAMKKNKYTAKYHILLWINLRGSC